jgi:short subunit dehydrogenase-like uncharacterized protein
MIGILGATGYTGALVASYFAREMTHAPYLLAARNQSRLDDLRAGTGTPGGVPTVVADVRDRPSLRALVARCSVVVNCVGPFSEHGLDVIAACVELGRHYIDITGEPGFLHRAIERFDEPARRKTLRIVLSAGFDSVPTDCAVVCCEEGLDLGASRTLHGSVHVSGPGSLSSGSLRGLSEGTRATLVSSFARFPRTRIGRRGPAAAVLRHGAGRRWLLRTPTIDAHVVRRTHDLLGHGGLSYAHFVEFDSLPRLVRFVFSVGGLMLSSRMPWRRRAWAAARRRGRGPSDDARRTSAFKITVRGHDAGGRMATARVCGPEPYEATAACVTEIARLVAYEPAALRPQAGVCTPGALGARVILERVARHGITLAVTSD